jgi:hypothetical protein
VADVPPQVEWFPNLSGQTPHQSAHALRPVALHEIDAKTTDALNGERLVRTIWKRSDRRLAFSGSALCGAVSFIMMPAMASQRSPLAGDLWASILAVLRPIAPLRRQSLKKVRQRFADAKTPLLF